MLELLDINLQIGTKKIVSKVNHRFSRAKTTAIVGHNGSGKTSLLKICLGLLKPAKGRIVWDEKLTKGQIGYMPQQMALLDRSVIENIEYVKRALQRAHHKNIHQDIDELLVKMKLEQIQHNKVANISGGEKKRLVLACALIGKPQLLLLDEPAANLDPENADMIDAILIEQKQRKCTILLITHYLYQIRRIADEICFMNKGSIVEHGNAIEVLAAPKHQVLRAYLNRR